MSQGCCWSTSHCGDVNTPSGRYRRQSNIKYWLEMWGNLWHTRWFYKHVGTYVYIYKYVLSVNTFVRSYWEKHRIIHYEFVMYDTFTIRNKVVVACEKLWLDSEQWWSAVCCGRQYTPGFVPAIPNEVEKINFYFIVLSSWEIHCEIILL